MIIYFFIKNVFKYTPVLTEIQMFPKQKKEKIIPEQRFQCPENKKECFFYFRFEKMRKGCILRK